LASKCCSELVWDNPQACAFVFWRMRGQAMSRRWQGEASSAE
jgi:hypothetical protein